jgi:hypothetical protein
MSDRDFWIVIRRALLLMVDAIERRYGLGKHSKVSAPGESYQQ